MRRDSGVWFMRLGYRSVPAGSIRDGTEVGVPRYGAYEAGAPASSSSCARALRLETPSLR